MQAAEALAPGDSQHLELSGGQSLEVPLTTPLGPSARVYADQIGIDVVLAALDESGSVLLESSAAGERNAEELLMLPAAARALRVSSASPGAPPGLVKLTFRAGEPSLQDQYLAWGNIHFARRRQSPGADGACGAAAPTGYAAAAQCYGAAARLAPGHNAYPLFLQADAVRASSDYDQAISLYALAEVAAREGGKSPAMLETLGAIYAGWGWSLSRQGNFDQARTILSRARTTVEQLVQENPGHKGHQYDLGSVQNNVCLQDLRQDRLQRATQCLFQLETLAARIGDENLQLLTWNGLGGLHQLLGQPDEAVAYFQKSLSLAKAKQDRRRQALLHNNLGWTYRSSSEYAKGIQHALEAVSISAELEWTDQTALAQANLGRLYALVGDYDRARHWFNTSIQGSKQDRRLATRYLSLGQIEFAEARFEEALRAYQRAAALVATLEAPKLQVRVADRLVRVNLALGNIGAAQRVIERTAPAAKLVEDRFSLASYDLAVADHELATGDFVTARKLYARALPIYEELGFSTGMANTHFGLARCALMAGDRSAAISYSDRAIEQLEATRERLWTLFERVNFNRIGAEIYAFAVDLHMANFRLSGRSEDALRALLIAERRKAQTLSELVGQTDLATSDDQASTAAASARRRVAALQAQLLELSDQPDRQALSAQLKSAYFEALDKLQSAELAYAVGRADNRRTLPLTGSAIERLVSDYQNVLSFFVGPEKSYAWRWDSDGLQAFDLPGRDSIEAWVSSLLQSLRVPGASFPVTEASPILGALQRVLPARGEDVERVLIAADGALSLVPFAALPLNSGEPLVTRAEVTLSPGLAVIASATGRQRTAETTAMVLADPVFSASDRRLGAQRKRGHTAAGLALPRLAGTRAEAAVLRELIPASKLVSLTDLAATRKNLLDLRLDEFDLLHFGTHGLLDRNTPDGYGLALTRTAADGSALDWLLNIHDIARMSLTSDLVVLSGCDTAQGEHIDGAGIVGLTRAFLYAGSRQVMSTLWQVSDRSTARLMQEFYRSYLHDGKTAAAALRQAQLTMRKRAGAEHPYHWAAFVVSTGSPASASNVIQASATFTTGEKP